MNLGHDGLAQITATFPPRLLAHLQGEYDLPKRMTLPETDRLVAELRSDVVAYECGSIITVRVSCVDNCRIQSENSSQPLFLRDQILF